MSSYIVNTARNLVSRPRICVCRSFVARSAHSSLPNTARNFGRPSRESRDPKPRAGANLKHGLADEPILDDIVSSSQASKSTPLGTDAATSNRAGQTLFVAGIPKVAREQYLTEYFENLGVIVRDAFVPSAYNQNGQRRRNNRGFGFVEVGSVKEHQQLMKLFKTKKIEFDLKPAKWDIDHARLHGAPTSSPLAKSETESKGSKAKPNGKARSKPMAEQEETEKKKKRRKIPFFPKH